MSYREFAPPNALSNAIECVWTRMPDSQYGSVAAESSQVGSQSILPDGAMDVIATFFPDGELDQIFVVGAMTAPQLATLGNQPLVGVRFFPGVGGSALGINATAVTDDQVGLRDVRQFGAGMFDAFRALHLDASNAHALHLFASSLGLESQRIPPIIRQAAHQLADGTSRYRVELVANDLRVSRQHLTRMFAAHSGLTPKRFAQICRVRALLTAAQSRAMPAAAVRDGVSDDRVANVQSGSTAVGARGRMVPPRLSWSQLAAEFGYADQSHLIAEVHAIIGQTPAAWCAATGSNIPIVPVPVAPL